MVLKLLKNVLLYLTFFCILMVVVLGFFLGQTTDLFMLFVSLSAYGVVAHYGACLFSSIFIKEVIEK